MCTCLLAAVKSPLITKAGGPGGDQNRPQRCSYCRVYAVTSDLRLSMLYSSACFLHSQAGMHTDPDLQFRDLWRSDRYETQQRWDFRLLPRVFNCDPSERDSKGPDRQRFVSLSHSLCLILCLSPPGLSPGTLTAVLGAESRQKKNKLPHHGVVCKTRWCRCTFTE